MCSSVKLVIPKLNILCYIILLHTNLVIVVVLVGAGGQVR